jgi:hypothetical protein
MDLLPIGDGSTYIDVAGAKPFIIDGVTYYRSQHGVWVRKEGEDRPLGQIVPERQAFRIFMNARMFDEAAAYFESLYAAGEVGTIVESNATRAEKATSGHLIRLMLGGLVGLLVIAYVVAVIAGWVSANRQLSIADLGIIAIGVVVIGILLRPQLVRDIQQFELGGFKVQLRDQLRGLQETQKNQSEELDELRFALELIVTPNERKHLEHLAKGSHVPYDRVDSLQAELRRLRTIGLISSKRYIFEMPDKFDLAEWVELTDRGREYLRHWKELGGPPGWPAQADGGSVDKQQT